MGGATDSRRGAASTSGSRSTARWGDYDIAIPGHPVSAMPEKLEDVSEWGVVWPSRRSLLSTIYHMPADATVVGLQHVARYLEADGLNRDLRSISRHGNKLVFAVLAAWWWFLFMRALWALGSVLLGFVKAILSSLGLVTDE